MSNPHRLPDDVVPVHYDLSIEPDLSAFRFKGEAAIEVEVRRPTREIVLNAADLEIAAATLDGNPVRWTLDARRERIALRPSRPLRKGRARIAFSYTGPIADTMRGLYRCRYAAPEGGERWLAATQFEATSARRAFPCFDEPALKATFDLTVVAPPGLAALSNMPPACEESAGGGRRRIRFARAPRMSTYLLALAVGEFDFLEGRTKAGLPVRVYAPPGRAGLGRFALETAIRGLEFYDGYYAIPYGAALPKCDLLALPDFEAGAMENWGLITFRETAIFVDPERSSLSQRRRVAEVVLHELAHQWFGNLATPKWWSYLWLNEAFATYLAFKAADALFPKWRVWESYVAQTTASGIALDSLRSSHPVEVPVNDPSEVDQIFDAISYNKGGSVLRMLEEAVGPRAFREGIRRYLRRFAYGCARSDDFWRAMGPAIPRMMDGWTRRTGLPVVHARREGGSLLLRQERFLLDPDPERDGADPSLWDIPIRILAPSGRTSRARLAAREGRTHSPGPWAKLNAGQAGFYLTNYDEPSWAALGKALPRLPPMDRFGLQADAYSLTRAGRLSVGTYLRLLNGCRREGNRQVWGGISGGLHALSEIFEGHPLRPRLEEWAWRLFRPKAALLGWEERPEEDEERRLLRTAILSSSVHFGDPEAVAEVKRRFEAARRDLASAPPNLQGLVFSGAARHGDEATLDALISMVESAPLAETRARLLSATGALRRPGALRRAAAYSLSDKVRAQDAAYAFGGVPIETRRAAWEIVKENWELLDRRFGQSWMIGGFIQAAASGIPSEAHAADVEAFFRDHPAPYATERIRQTLEGIRARARFRIRSEKALVEFFKERGENSPPS